MTEIKLGDKVRDKVSGFVGIATSKTEFMNGCIQYDIIPKVGKDNKPVEGLSIDIINLEVIKRAKPKIEEDETGGPNHASIKMRGY
jgi:hypothetical protein